MRKIIKNLEYLGKVPDGYEATFFKKDDKIFIVAANLEKPVLLKELSQDFDGEWEEVEFEWSIKRQT